LNIGCDVRLLFGGPLCFHLLKELLIAIQVIAQLLKFTQSNLSMSKAPLALDDQRHWRGGWWLGRLAHESRRSHGEDWRCFLIRDGHSRRHRHHNTWPVFPSLMIFSLRVLVGLLIALLPSCRCVCCHYRSLS